MDSLKIKSQFKKLNIDYEDVRKNRVEIDLEDPRLVKLYPGNFVRNFKKDGIRLYHFSSLTTKMIYSMEKKAIYLDLDYYIDNKAMTSEFMLNLRYLYRQIRSGYYVFLNLNSVTELSPFMKKVSQYLSETNIDKVKNILSEKAKRELASWVLIN